MISRLPRRARGAALPLLATLALSLLAACGGDDGGADAGPPVTDQTIVSEGLDFDVTSFAVPAGEEVTVTYDNQHDRVQHNVHFQVEAADGEEPKTELTAGPDTQTLTFTIEDPGEYDYICDLHPAQMKGTLVVEDAA